MIIATTLTRRMDGFLVCVAKHLHLYLYISINLDLNWSRKQLRSRQFNLRVALHLFLLAPLLLLATIESSGENKWIDGYINKGSRNTLFKKNTSLDTLKWPAVVW